ncbi:MAG: hypothetical protein R3Y64_10695, partial [Peptostreptococcaceae bacterium]
MNKIVVNLMFNPTMDKPQATEYGKIQNRICNDDNLRELPLEEFADLVGNKGAFWKSSLMIGGSSNNNFKEAYVISLDFDDGLTIDTFLGQARDLELEPTFIYKTLSHTKQNPRFRAVWQLKEPITNIDIKNIIQKTIMKVFEECDRNCKDLSRLWVGGKELSFFDKFNYLNIENLFNALVTNRTIKSPKHFTRDLEEIDCKYIGIDMYNNLPFVIKEFDKIDLTKIDNLHLIEYGGFTFSRSKTNINKNGDTKFDPKKLEIDNDASKKKIDFDKVEEKCYLYFDFVNGTNSKLNHHEIAHLTYNLYGFKGYKTKLLNALQEHNYNNILNKYNIYKSCVGYDYDPSSCNGKCKYYSQCNATNIINKCKLNDTKAKKIDDITSIPLAEGEKLLENFFKDIDKYTKDDFVLGKFPVGIGKTEFLTRMNLDNTVIGVSNHKLGFEVFNRLKDSGKEDIFYIRPLDMDKLPKELKEKINHLYNLGMPKKVKELVYEEIKKINKESQEDNQKPIPKHFEDLKEYVEQLDQVHNYNSLIFTHHRLSNGNLNTKIDTLIIDEDFLKAFIKYDTFNVRSIMRDLGLILEWSYSKNSENYKILRTFLEDFNKNVSSIDNTWEPNILLDYEPGDIDIIKNLLIRFLMEKDNINKISNNIFSAINCEYYKIHNGIMHFVNGRRISELEPYKVIVLSATLDKDIHTRFIEKYLPNKKVIFEKCDNVDLKGNLYCDTTHSISRSSLYFETNTDDEIDNNLNDENKKKKTMTKKMKDKLDYILSSTEFENVITFKNHNLELEKNNKTQILHFGAVEGIDQYKGQNLAVIGTPHINSNLYEAYGVLINNGQGPVSEQWKVKQVKRNGYLFNLNSYEDEKDTLFTDIQ